ncbi:MAG: DUF4097 family beta strand repeat-containing protein [Romboutsia sp.]
MKYSKLVIKIAVIIIFAGTIMAFIGYVMGGKTNIKSSGLYISTKNVNHIIKNEELGEFNNVDIDVNLDYIELIKSDKNKIELNYSEDLNKVDYKIDNNNLTIKQESKKLVDININLFGFMEENKSYMKLYISESELENIKINSNYTDIKIEGVSGNVVNIKCDYANLDVDNLNGKSGNISMKDGNIDLSNIKIEDTFELKNSYGNIGISNSQFQNLISNINDGNIEILNSIIKNSKITNDYGNINLVDSYSEGINIYCKDGRVELDGSFRGYTTIDNKYGNVELDLDNYEKEYGYSIVNKYGSIKINDVSMEGSIINNNNSENTINVNCTDGNININFEK